MFVVGEKVRLKRKYMQKIDEGEIKGRERGVEEKKTSTEGFYA